MSEKEGILQMQPSGRWAVCRPGWDSGIARGTVATPLTAIRCATVCAPRSGRNELRPSERHFFFWFRLCSAAVGATTAIIEGPSIETGLNVTLLVSATIFLLLATWANRL
jgi:hypothetical protein